MIIADPLLRLIKGVASESSFSLLARLGLRPQSDAGTANQDGAGKHVLNSGCAIGASWTQRRGGEGPVVRLYGLVFWAEAR